MNDFHIGEDLTICLQSVLKDDIFFFLNAFSVVEED